MHSSVTISQLLALLRPHTRPSQHIRKQTATAYMHICEYALPTKYIPLNVCSNCQFSIARSKEMHNL